MATWVDLDDDEVVYCGNRGEYENYNIPPEMLEHSVDAVPVVRCGECKHMMADGRCFEFADDNIRPSVSDYCSRGERREE